MDLLVEKTSEEIGEIWQNYHRYKDGLAAVMPGHVYKTLRARGQTYPTFLLPLPRSEGYEFVVTQFHNNEVHFALLAEYQLHKENAPECMSLTYYAELLDTKDIVLMRGEFDSVRLSVLEAQCLANTLQLYYCGPEHPERTRLLKTFNANPAKFDHMELIAAMENVGFGEMPGPMGKHPKPPASPQPKS
ncbi:hypothetical protein AAG570_004904 [Ranatra chinensis]|uniref:ATP synthase mitochondrial F1 complex assembly factor 1 n=1 Tax=Ranatra chinensis TaxID=642074 RepID=A0ABD0Y0I3_9HEMI